MRRQQYLAVTLSGIAAIGASVVLFRTTPVVAQAQRSAAVFNSDGKMQLPTGYRRWVFVGAPLTPDGLNKGRLISQIPQCIRRSAKRRCLSEDRFIP
jgi:hypothetical protein